MTAISPPRTRTNPYIGPRAFEEGERLYGRDRELAALIDLLIAERIVLLYSPSGAGKTSLIQAGLLAELQREGFRVQPIIRVGREAHSAAVPGTPNRYLMSTLLCLEGNVPVDQQRPLEQLATMGLSEYLDSHPPQEQHSGEVLIFDQFEELLTLDPTDEAVKTAFLHAVGVALRSRDRWALFAMREDFIAGLDPHLRHLPTRLDAKFRLDLLREEQARTAIIQPARDAGVDFSASAAQKLVDDLRRVRVQGPRGPSEEPGPYVEPVQLQVACRSLWDRLPADVTVIEDSDVQLVGDVDSALAAYYIECVEVIAAETGTSERAIRDWFDSQLITEQGFRAQVLNGPDGPDGDQARDGQVLRLLLHAHLLRAENRRGATWFELAHDRLAQPLRASNRAWREANLNVLQRQAVVWDKNDRSSDLLLNGEALQEAERWTARHENELSPVERTFLNASRTARSEHERRHRQAGILRLAVFASIISLIALPALIFALLQLDRARQARGQAEALALAAEAVGNLDFDSNLSLLLALEAVSKAPSTETSVGLDARASLYRAVNASARTATLPELDVYRIAFSPDGTSFLTVGLSPQTTATMWDTRSRRMRFPLDGHQRPVLDAAFSADGARVATSSSDGTAKVWDAATGRELRTLESRDGAVSGISFSPDGRMATAGAGQTAKVWDLVSGAELLALRGHTAWVRDVDFARDGGRLATVSDDGTAILWDARTASPLRRLEGHAGPVYRVVFSPDGTRLATAGRDGTAKVWDLAYDTETLTLQGHSDVVNDVAFSADGRYLATAGNDETARIWDVSSGDPLLTLNSEGGPVTSVAFSANGSSLAVASSQGAPRLVDIASSLRRHALGHSGPIYSLAFGPDSRLLATASADSTAKIWKTESGEELITLRGHGLRIGDRFVAVPVLDVAFNSDGTRAATASSDRTARVWDAATGQTLAILEGHGDIVSGVAFSPDGLVATAGQDSTARVWDPTTGGLLLLLSGHRGGVTDVTFSPNGQRLATAGNDGRAIVWDSGSGEQLQVLRGHSGPVNAVAFSPDGERLATAGADETARVWDVASGESLITVSDHTGWVSEVAFSSDGKLLTASSDGTIRMWDVDSERETLRIPQEAAVVAMSLAPEGGSLAAVVGLDATQYSVTPLDRLALVDVARSGLHRSWRPEECRRYLHVDECPAA